MMKTNEIYMFFERKRKKNLTNAQKYIMHRTEHTRMRVRVKSSSGQSMKPNRLKKKEY